jgi:hypothetical protein
MGDRIMSLVQVTNTCGLYVPISLFTLPTAGHDAEMAPGENIVLDAWELSVITVHELQKQGILDIMPIPDRPAVREHAKKDRWGLVE